MEIKELIAEAEQDDSVKLSDLRAQEWGMQLVVLMGGIYVLLVDKKSAYANIPEYLFGMVLLMVLCTFVMLAIIKVRSSQIKKRAIKNYIKKHFEDQKKALVRQALEEFETLTTPPVFH